MKISIVTACYNSSATIRDAMKSVARQRIEKGGGESRSTADETLSLEYIVVDGGSTDGTVEAIREFDERVRRNEEDGGRAGFSFKWVSECDRGMYDAINKGIRMATGDAVGILNADDVLASEDVVARIAEEFGEEECVYGKVYFVNELGGKMVRRCFAQLWRPWMLQWGYMPPHPGIFIRRACFEKWGGYEPDRREYRIAADYELLIRFFRVKRMRAKYVKMYTTIMRTGGVSTKDVEARKKLNEEIIKANRVNGYFCCWPMLLPKYAIKVWEVILPKLGICG